MTRGKAKLLRQLIEQLSATLTDEIALTSIELFPIWQANKEYSLDSRVQFDNKLYKCVQAHTSQTNLTPNSTQALWTLVSIEEWPEWIQPTGAQDAYKKGAKVSHNGSKWISDVDANTWEPGVFGWTKEE